MSLISAEMRALVGSVTDRSTSYPICESDIRRWRIAVSWPHEPDAQALSGPAPLDFNPFAWGASRRDPAAPTDTGAGALEQRLGIAPPPVRVMLNGGLSVEYGEARMRPGDTIRSETRIAGYEERVGRTGPLLLTTLESRWTNQSGELIKTARMTLLRF